jgi:hypothetical protein
VEDIAGISPSIMQVGMYVFKSMACSSSKRGIVLDEFLDFYEFYFWIRCVSAWLSSSGRWKGEAGGL